MKKKFREAARQIILKAGRYLKENRKKIKNITFKGAINLVTNLDREVESILIKSLRRKFPEIGFLSEEVGGIRGRSDLKWVIDPIDGTTNFAHGFPFYAISMALEEDKETLLGLVYDPERDELFYAEKGRGARLNEKPIKISAQKDLKRCLLVTGFSYKLGESMEKNLVHFRNFLITSQAVRRMGSASLDLCYVACGRFDGFWELDLQPWDTAAAWLIVKEAGGEITDFSGLKYNPYMKQILATNGNIHGRMLNILRLKNPLKSFQIPS